MKVTISLEKLFLITILVGSALSITCPTGYKDDGTGICIPISNPCAAEYKDDGSGTCISSGQSCAVGYHDDGSGDKCISKGAQCTFKFHDDGSGQICLAADEACPNGFKDDGTLQKCIPSGQPCQIGFIDSGNGKCIVVGQPCSADYRDDGTGKACISLNDTCADNYQDNYIGDKCILNCTLQEKNNGQGVCIYVNDSCALGYTSENPSISEDCNSCEMQYKNDGTGKCVLFSQYCANGYKDNGQGLCVLFTAACATKYTTDGNGYNCLGCAIGYKNDGQGTCVLLTDLCALGYKDDGTGVCVDIFIKCAHGYKDIGNGLCVSQSSSCAANYRDNGNGYCIIIDENDVIIFNLKDPSGRKAKCDPLCSNCNLGGQCKTCKVGYALKASTEKCVVCDGCLTCTALAPSECTSCFPPLALNKTSKTCVDVNCTIENCLQCNIDATCKTCFAGYASINNTCQQCQVQNCKSCTTSLLTCDSSSCLEGYIYLQKKNKCLPCATGCKGCKQTDVSQCVGCNSGYYSSQVDGITRCTRCFDNCAECSSSSVCTKCTTGYIVSEDGSQCQIKCSDTCATCDNQNPDKCLTCFSGANLDSITSKCITDLSCNTNNTCSSCSQGYVISQSHCYQCTYNKTNCIACTHQLMNNCAKCSTGYYLKQGECRACVDNCVSCWGKGACIKCSAGYYLTKEDNSPTGKCKQCDDSCLTCSGNPRLCTSCPDTYTLSGSSCLSPNRVVVIIKLGIPLQQFIQYYESLILWFISKVTSFRQSSSSSFTRRHIVLFSLKSGSVDINSGLQMDNAGNVNSVSSGLTNAMSSGSQSIDGLVVSGSAVGTTQATSASNSSNNLGLILGIAIPLGILILIGIIVIIVKIYGRKLPSDKFDKEDSQQHNNHSGKQFYSAENYAQKQ